jgi:hypothetical protein
LIYFHSHLLHASEEIQALSKRNVVRRFFSHATDAETISVIEKDIEDAIRLFEVSQEAVSRCVAAYPQTLSGQEPSWNCCGCEIPSYVHLFY